MQTVREFMPADRYVYDFGPCSYANGFAQIDTKQDASYFGTWCSPSKRAIVSYCEGDVTTQIAETDKEFADIVRELADWTNNAGHGPMKIDAINTPIGDALAAMGLADLLH